MFEMVNMYKWVQVKYGGIKHQLHCKYEHKIIIELNGANKNELKTYNLI